MATGMTDTQNQPPLLVINKANENANLPHLHPHHHPSATNINHISDCPALCGFFFCRKLLFTIRYSKFHL